MGAVVTLWLKQMRRFTRSPMEIMATLFLPALLVGLFGTGMRSAMGRLEVFAGDYVSYMAPGAAALAVVSAAVLGGAGLLQDRLTGVLKQYLVAPVPRAAILVGAVAGAVTKALLQAVVVLALAGAVGARFLPEPAGLVAAAAGLVAFTVGFSAFAAYFAGLASSMAAYHAVIMVFNVPILFVSSALYPLDRLPGWLQALALLNPTTYVVELLRLGLLGLASPVPVSAAVVVLVAFGALGVLAGSRGARRWANPQ